MQAKSAKDLAEMRFYQVFKEAYDEMMLKSEQNGTPIFTVITIEKED